MVWGADPTGGGVFWKKIGGGGCRGGKGEWEKPMAFGTAERNRHAYRCWTCSNEEGWLCLRLLDAGGRAQPRVHLRSDRRCPSRPQLRNQIPQKGGFGSHDRLQHGR